MNKDSFGNIIEKKMQKTRMTYLLHLKNRPDDYPRALGHFKLDRWSRKPIFDRFYLKRDEDFHYHRATKSYGFNDKLMHMLDPEVVLIIKIKQYELKRKILVKDVLEKGQHLTFSNKGFETQIFVEERDLELVT